MLTECPALYLICEMSIWGLVMKFAMDFSDRMSKSITNIIANKLFTDSCQSVARSVSKKFSDGFFYFTDGCFCH